MADAWGRHDGQAMPANYLCTHDPLRREIDRCNMNCYRHHGDRHFRAHVRSMQIGTMVLKLVLMGVRQAHAGCSSMNGTTYCVKE